LCKSRSWNQRLGADDANPRGTGRHWRVAERPVRPKLASVIGLTKATYRLLLKDWKLILGIALWYGVLNLVLVRGLNGGLNVAELQAQFGSLNSIASALGIFSLLVSSSNNGAATDASAYQTILIVITSLALIWSFRQLLADAPQKIRIRDSFYRGMYPLIPVLLIVLVISVQLLPMLIASALYSVVISSGIAVNTAEVIISLLILLAGIVWSLLLITPSIFALYIVSLPEMTPLRALRSAKALVRYRRPTVLRKILFLPLLIILILAAIIIPIIFVAPVLAQWVYLALSILLLPTIHGYLYTLYRELLDE